MTVDAWTKTAGSDGDLNAISRLISVLVSKFDEWLDSKILREQGCAPYW